MYVIIITWSCSDPQAFGPYKSEKSAQIALKQIKSEWTERDYYKGECYIKTFTK